MPKYRVTIPSITWLGDHNAPSATRTVNSRNAKLAVHAAYQKITRAKDNFLCYDHNWRNAKVVKVKGNTLTPIGMGKLREQKGPVSFRKMLGLAA